MERLAAYLYTIVAVITLSYVPYDTYAARDTTGVTKSEFIYGDGIVPSCHASTIVETSDGHLAVAFFGGTQESNADCCIWLSRLEEEGWSTPVTVADGMLGNVKTACWNPVLFQIPGGELLLFYKVGRFVQDWSGWMLRSKDCGLSWSSPEALPQGILGPIKNKPLLYGGRLLCGSSLEKGGWRVYLETADPNVSSWTRKGPLNDRKSSIQIIQPALFAHPDGQLQMICRNIDIRGNIISLTSDDGGKTWSEPFSTGLPNNDSGLDAIALSDGRFLLVYNHINATRNGAGARSPINVALSDNGKDWYSALQLEDVPGDEYSYPAVIQTSDGMVHIVYTWNRRRIRHIVIDPTRLVIDRERKITDERWEPDKTLTSEEKMALMSGTWVPHYRGTHDLYAGGVPRLGISPFRMEYAVHGVHTNVKSTSYPCPLALAASYDMDNIRKVGESIGTDCKARGIQAAFGPVLNFYSPDDAEFQACTYGSEGDHIAACAEAFALGLSDSGIMPIAIYAATEGRDTLKESAVLTEVLSRNTVGGLIVSGTADGHPAASDSLYNRAIVRGKAGFEGMVLADCSGLTAYEAVHGGIDIDIPQGKTLNQDNLKDLVKNDTSAEEMIDRSARRITETANRFRLNSGTGADTEIDENREESISVSLEAARKGIVLLKDTGHILPLEDSGKGILVLGNRVYCNSSTDGETSVYPFSEITVADVLMKRKDVTMPEKARKFVDLSLTDEFSTDGMPGLKAEYFSTQDFSGQPRFSRIETSIDYAGDDPMTDSGFCGQFSARWTGTLSVKTESVIRLEVSGTGGLELAIDGEKIPAADDGAGHRIIHMLHARPGETHSITISYICGENGSDIQFTYSPVRTNGLEAMMKKAGTILICAGSDGKEDAESVFWSRIARRYRKKTVLVMQSCDVSMVEEWCRNADAVLIAWHPGQCAGQAIADILTGRTAPSGRMPVKTAAFPLGYRFEGKYRPL